MAEACLVRTLVTRVLNSSRSCASAAAPRSLARAFWSEPRWSMAAAAITPRWSETAFSPASFPGVNFSIGACLLRALILCLPRVILHSERRVLLRDDQREEGLTPICTDDTDFWIAVVLLLLLAGRVCAVSLEEAVGLFFGEVFFFVILLFVFFVVEVIEVVGIEGGAWFGEVEAFGGGFDGADGVGGVGFGVEAAGVVAGELQAVEESCGSLGVGCSGGRGVAAGRAGDL